MHNFQSLIWRRGWLLLVLLLVCWTAVASPQQVATLPDGTKVVLYDDFTWAYYGQNITYEFDFSTLSPDTLPEFLRQGFQVEVSIQTTAVEMFLQGWRYTMPSPKSAQAAWGNSDGRTTWFCGYWYNSSTDQASSAQPEKRQNGMYLGDGQDFRNCYRHGGTPRFPTELEWLLSQQWISEETSPLAGGYGAGVVATDDDIYVLECQDVTNACNFFSYSVSRGVWIQETTAGLETGMFRNGSVLAWDGDEIIYALAGARYKDSSRAIFMRYQIGADSWERLANTPVAQGAGNAIAWVGYDSAIYAFVGSAKHNSGSSSFVRYAPETKTWEILESPWKSTDDGASLSWDGDMYLYAFRGEYDEVIPNGEFARFNLSSGTWEKPLADLPDSEGVGDGGSLLSIAQWKEEHSDYIYALSGGSVSEAPGYGFYRYSISMDGWERLSDIPCPIGYYVGRRLAYAAGKIYYWQGSPVSDKWLCGGDAFFSMQVDLPVPIQANADVECPLASLVINEIEMNPAGEDSGAEWVEIYNPTDTSVNLAGWSVSYTNYGGGWEDLPSVEIQPGAYFVYTYSKRRLHNENGKQVHLRNTYGAVVDSTAAGLKDTRDDSYTYQRIPDASDCWRFVNATREDSNNRN